jgi:ligand-binding sensor domain-containing protein/two-component sensor histidine kinase
LDPASPVSQYSHSIWQTSDGLPNNSVQALAQTRDGYLWLGTLEGLVRFDGHHFRVFDTKNTAALKHNSVVTLCEDRRGVLWIGTSGGGVTWYENGKFSGPLAGLPNSYIRAIHEDAAGNIWITAHDGGLVRYSGNTFRVITTKDGLPSNSVRTVLSEPNGDVWIGTDEDGAALLRKGTLTRFGPMEGLTNGQVRALYRDGKGRLWVGTRGGGLFVYKSGRFVSFAGNRDLASKAIRGLLEDRDGNLWIATENGGLARFRDGSVARLTSRDGLPHSFVRALLEDTDGSLWLGTRGGLVRLKNKKVLTLTTSDGLISDNVRTVFGDAQGRVWLGTATGLSCWLNGRFFRAADWPKDAIRAITQAADGTMWFGAGSVLFSWREGKIQRYSFANGLPAAPIRALVEDRRGRLWIGTSAGLAILEKGRLRHAGKLPSLDIRALAEDRSGRIWVGTSEGVVQYEDGAVHTYTSDDGLAHNVVTTLYVDRANVLWVGTRGGLSRLRDGKLLKFTRRDGLLSDNILELVEDDFGHFWISSKRGVARIARTDLEAFASGVRHEIPSIVYDTADGMKSSECNGGAQPAGWKTRDGRVWFATVHGVVVFDPREARPPMAPPRAVIEAVVAGRESIQAAGSQPVRIRAGESDFEIQYTAISLAAPERVRFRYRLDGFDSDWIDAGQRRSAYYTNLPPGDYRFRVTAYDRDGGAPGEEAAAMLQLEPFFYQTAWFPFACLGLLAGAAAASYRLRIRSLHRGYAAILAERARIGREIHDTLMQGVAGISLQLEAASQKLERAPREAKVEIDRALAQLDDALAETRQCVLELRTPKRPIQDLDAAIRALADRLASDRGVRTSIVIEGTKRRLPEHLQTNLLRIAREAITNAALHSHARHLSITLRFDDGQVRFQAVDDGCGFDAARLPGDHFGIVGMRERSEQLGGKLECRSAPGRGTEIDVIIPA